MRVCVYIHVNTYTHMPRHTTYALTCVCEGLYVIYECVSPKQAWKLQENPLFLENEKRKTSSKAPATPGAAQSIQRY